MAELTPGRSPAGTGREPAVTERAGVSGAARSARHEIRVEWVLDRHWTAWFEGLQIDRDDRQTVISGR